MSPKEIKNLSIVQKALNFANSSFVATIIIIISVWAFALIPTWFYLLCRMLIDPFGFWQELALFLVFFIVIGWLQGLLIFAGSILTLSAIAES
jgi:hypothetical protein